MFRFRRAPLMWALFALLWVGSSAAAQEKKLFAVDGASNNPATLYELDRTDGSIIETIGAIGFDHVTAIDFDPTTGVLYGIANGPTSFGPATLITIDLTFGIGTFVADISWDTPPFAFGENVPDMSFDSSGTLHVWREPFAGDDLYTVDKVTGVATLVAGSVDSSGIFTFSTGMAFDSTNRLYVKTSSDLFDVDPGTGVGTFLVTFDALDTRNMLAIDETNTLYTASRGGAGKLATIDPGTGVITPKALSHGIAKISALAFQPAPPACSAAVPSLSELWPPNHAMVWVDILGVSDVTIAAIRQDEPVRGRGAGRTGPDARGVGTSWARLRAERSGRGNGRVYEISFTADDGEGGSCSGTVEVGVRHDRGKGKKGGPAVNDGATFDSTVN